VPRPHSGIKLEVEAHSTIMLLPRGSSPAPECSGCT
jgi:hypothetical protein